MTTPNEKPKAAWHVHHDRLWEWLTKPIEERILYVKATKPAHEHELRLRLLRDIPADRIAPLIEAREQYKALRCQAWEQYKAVERSIDMEALHRELCPNCPWDGRTIFPEGVGG